MATPPMSKTLTLKIFRNDELVDTKTLSHDVIKIGRLPGSHLRLDADGVARMHAVIEVSGDDVRIIDLGTTSGTLLNGAAIEKASLSQGDSLTFGPYRVEIAEIADAAPAPAAPEQPDAHAPIAALHETKRLLGRLERATDLLDAAEVGRALTQALGPVLRAAAAEATVANAVEVASLRADLDDLNNALPPVVKKVETEVAARERWLLSAAYDYAFASAGYVRSSSGIALLCASDVSNMMEAHATTMLFNAKQLPACALGDLK